MSGNEAIPRPTHSQLVRALAKPGDDILRTLDPLKCHLWHMASCIPGEAGELFDAVKKLVIYAKPLDRANVVEELGDIEFYMEGLRHALDITREETLEGNIDKLSVRYGTKYSDAAAQTRADKLHHAHTPLPRIGSNTGPVGVPPERSFIGKPKPDPLPHRRADDNEVQPKDNSLD